MKLSLKTYLFKIVGIVMLTASPNYVFAQEKLIDSIETLIKNDKVDSIKILNLIDLSWIYGGNGMNNDSAITIANRALALAKKINSPFNIGRAHTSLSWYYYQKGEAIQALENGNIAIEIWEQLTADKTIPFDSLVYRAKASSFGNMGSIYRNQGNYPRALECFIKAIKISEELNDHEEIARHLGNTGLIYADQKEYKKALEYYFKALKIDEKSPSKVGLSFRLNNIGIIYFEMKNYPQALVYYIKGLKISEELNDKRKIARNLGNIGNIYSADGHYDIAFNYYTKALSINEEIKSKNGITIQLGNIGALLIKQNKYKEAEAYLLKALDIDTTIAYMKHAEDTYKNLHELYTAKKDFKNAFVYYKKYISVRDSLFNTDQINEITRQEMNYEFEKKEAITKAEQDKKDAITLKEKQEKQLILYSVVGGLLLVFILSVVIFRSLLTNKKKNKIISHQKELVEEKQKEILDSIRYAKRIQSSLLPTEKYIDKSLNRLKNDIN